MLHKLSLCLVRDITIDRETSTIFQLNIGLYCNQVRYNVRDEVLSLRTFGGCAFFTIMILVFPSEAFSVPRFVDSSQQLERYTQRHTAKWVAI